MAKFKQVALALATAGLWVTQAQADEAQAPILPPAPLAAFSQQDIGSLFDKAGQPMQLAALSDVEMRETEGEWLNFAIGGVIGFGTHAWQYGRNMTWRSAAIAAGTGALTSGVGGALIRASGGGIVGNVAWRPNMMAINFGVGQVNRPISIR